MFSGQLMCPHFWSVEVWGSMGVDTGPPPVLLDKRAMSPIGANLNYSAIFEKDRLTLCNKTASDSYGFK